MSIELTEAEREALDQSLADSGCHGFLGDHPDLYAAAEHIVEARLAPIRAVVDEWDKLAGTASKVWELYGPQRLSVPFAVEQIRAALRDATHTDAPDAAGEGAEGER